jgi:hypothetical protein
MGIGIRLFGLIASILFLGPQQQQVPRGNDPYSLLNVRSAMDNLSKGVVFGGDMKTIPRLGDASSIAILKLVDRHELTDPKTVIVILTMIDNAFSHPDQISINLDRDPKVTMFLLDYLLETVKDSEVQSKIRWTIQYVKQQTG